MTNWFEKISPNFQQVQERIADAAQRSGRSAQDVTLIAVTKYFSCQEEVIPALMRCGCFQFGENRPPLFLEKVQKYSTVREKLSQPNLCQTDLNQPILNQHDSGQKILWHFIGSLQRNKIRRILPHVSLLHSVDSVRLAQAIDRILDEEHQRKPLASEVVFPQKTSILLEVNISNESNKHGFDIQEIPAALDTLFELPHLEICGFMGMGGLLSSPEEVRRQFTSLRRLLEDSQRRFPEKQSFRELSMGMSHDFEIAIEEGATFIRLGSILFQEP